MIEAPIVGVLLAAGKSRRLPGQPKQLLDLGGKPLLQYGVDLLRGAARIDIVVVALGDHAEAIECEVDLTGCQVVTNQAPGDGCGGSITAAMTWVRANLDSPGGLVLIPGDQPLLSEAALSTVIEKGLIEKGLIEKGLIEKGPVEPGLIGLGLIEPDIAVARYDDGIGHPFFFGPKTFDRLAAAGGDKAAWKLVDNAGFNVAQIPIGGPVPRDVDTWDDYHQLRQELALL